MKKGDVVKTIGYKAVASNPGAAEQNVNAQKQFAAWLVHFGLAIGTIKKPMEGVVSKDGSRESVHLLQQEVYS